MILMMIALMKVRMNYLQPKRSNFLDHLCFSRCFFCCCASINLLSRLNYKLQSKVASDSGKDATVVKKVSSSEEEESEESSDDDEESDEETPKKKVWIFGISLFCSILLEGWCDDCLMYCCTYILDSGHRCRHDGCYNTTENCQAAGFEVCQESCKFHFPFQVSFKAHPNFFLFWLILSSRLQSHWIFFFVAPNSCNSSSSIYRIKDALCWKLIFSNWTSWCVRLGSLVPLNWIEYFIFIWSMLYCRNNFFKDAGEIVEIRFSTDAEGNFKGYGHVEFATAEAAQKVDFFICQFWIAHGSLMYKLNFCLCFLQVINYCLCIEYSKHCICTVKFRYWFRFLYKWYYFLILYACIWCFVLKYSMNGFVKFVTKLL